ncbi:soluble lytic murein transglycosylase-like protein [Sphingosinicella soli]|uniref:Soluble lytic murein transglycosylase-like protein n=2 Tax=Sphingosinicella soli TaxID=333708 RepID=A0A7W7B1Z8_9SPHN|nr:soluble lytic murein transglycosylase-like protein [Sphingosinicella soli]
MIAGLMLVAAPPHASAHADSLSRWRPHIEAASARFGVPAEWIERVIEAESGGRTTLKGRLIVSRAGAMGLMQLMPGTWAEMHARLRLGDDPHHPRDNIMAGTFYLRLMYDRFGYPGLFAAYNAGPRRYAQYLRQGRPLPAETRAYFASLVRPGPARPRSVAGTRLFHMNARSACAGNTNTLFFGCPGRLAAEASDSAGTGTLAPDMRSAN